MLSRAADILSRITSALPDNLSSTTPYTSV
jgi:hypothetical protein